MALNNQKKAQIVGEYQRGAEDTGSPEVQVAILTEEVKRLTDHLKEHKKDHSSRRGLLRKIGQRHRLLKYLSKEDPKRYDTLTTKLGLKKKEAAKDVSKGGAA